MSNLTYNPNVDIPPYHGFDNNDGPRAMDFPSDGNFKSGNISYDVSYDMNPREQHRNEPRYDARNEPRYEPRYDARYEHRHEQYDAQPRPKRKIKENMATNTDKFSWILLLKKIVIYTILFLVFNHIKTHEIVCGLLPFLSNNDLLCMTFKGIVFALIITILLPIVL